MSEVHPSSSETHEPLRVVIVDISEHRRQMARDAADSRLGAETAVTRRGIWENIKDFKGMTRRVWKGNILREYYQQKYYRQELDSLDANDNLYAADGGDDHDATVAVVNRFASDFDEVIHTDAGERRDLYGEGDTAPNNIRSNIKDLISEFASGAIDEAAFEEEKNRVCALLANGNQDKIAGGLLYADNLLEIAQNVKAAVEHGRGLEDVMAGMEIVAGEAKMGARTEARFNRVDKIVDKLSRTKIGSLLPEALIASSVAVAVAASKFLTQKTVAMATAVTGVLGISGGILGGLRESKRIKEERALHMRERAGGKQIETNSKRREALEETRYETVAANDATTELSNFFNEDGSMRNLTGTEYERAVAYISQIGSRIKRSDIEKIDLIHFSSVDAIEDERFALDLALARAKVGLRDYLATQPPDFLPPGLRASNFDSLNSMFTGAIDAEFGRSQSAKDDVFRTLKRKAVLGAATKGFGFGMVFGALTQEGAAHIPGYDSYAGLGESTDGAERTTLLRGWLQGHDSTTTVESGGSAESLVSTPTGSHSSISVPEGYSVQNGSNGEFVLSDPKGNVVTSFEANSDGQISAADLAELKSKGATVETITDQHGGLSGDTKNIPVYSIDNKLNIPKEYDMRPVEGGDPTRFELVNQNNEPVAQFTLNPDGTIPDSSRGELAAAGIALTDKVDLISTTEPSGPVTPEELVWINGKDTEGVRRVLWYGNDTPGKYDLNELRTHAGGVEGTWFDADGNVVVDISAMRPDGSFWNGQSANPDALAADGSLRLAISVSKSTQDNVFDFKFETTPDGRTIAVIPKDSPVHQLFEPGNQENGHGEFNGRYIEIMEFTGEKDPAGAEQVKILGTYLGDNDQEGITSVIETTKEAHTTTLAALPVETQLVTYNPEIVTVTESGIDVSPIVPIPIFGRRGLERLKMSESPEVQTPENGYYGYNRANWQETEGRWKEERSPRLKDNPNADLDTGEELSWYRSQQMTKRGPEYLQEIDSYINSNEVLRNMNGDTKALVCIPVAAAAESENVYNTISLYAQQSESAQKGTVIVMNLNWLEKLESDPDKMAKIQKTISEVERAKADFPNLNIATFTKKWTDAFLEERNNKIYGEVIKVLYDTAALAMERSIREGRRASDNEAVLITNDADAQGLRRDYLDRYISAVEKYPTADVFTGLIRWGSEESNDYPGYGLANGFYGAINMLTQRPGNLKSNMSSTGPNSGFRLSTYAAIGGCEDRKDMGAGADAVLGHRVRSARWGSHAFQDASGEWHHGRIIAKHIVGAQVDTLADRLLGAYRQGKWIADGWNQFDVGGYQERTVSAAGGTTGPENIEEDIDAICSRVEASVIGFASNWYNDPALVSTALGMYFGINDKEGKPLYEQSWTSEGRLNFKFTDAGKLHLKKRLLRNSRGQYDPLGNRVGRRLYNRTQPGAKILPKNSEPRFVSH